MGTRVGTTFRRWELNATADTTNWCLGLPGLVTTTAYDSWGQYPTSVTIGTVNLTTSRTWNRVQRQAKVDLSAVAVRLLFRW